MVIALGTSRTNDVGTSGNSMEGIQVTVGSSWSRRRLARRTVLRGVSTAGAGLLGAALIGCRGGGDEPAAPSTGATAAPASKAQAAAAPGKPKSGGILRYASSSAIAHFDPHQSVTPASQTNLWHLIGNQLVRMNSTKLLVEGDLAMSWENPDPQTFVFKMQPNARWHNEAPMNGRPITAQDVIYSLKRTATNEPLFVRKSQYGNVKTFEAVDDRTVKLVLSEPSVPFLATLGDVYETVVAKEVVEKHGDLKQVQAAHGGGPFMVDKSTFDKDVGGKFRRNPDYFKKDAAGGKIPYLDGIEYQFIGDASALYAALTTGKVDIGSVPPENEADFRRGNPNWQINEIKGLSRDGILLNTSKAPFTDVRVRLAISHALDRNLILKLGRGRGTLTPAVSPAMEYWSLPSAELQKYPGFRKEGDKAAIEKDRAEAKKLLEAAGHKDGFEMPMETTTAYSYNLLAETAIPQLQAIGLKFKITLLEWGVLKEHEATGNFTIAASNWYSGPEPDLHLYLYHHKAGGRNYSKLDDPELNSLIEKQRVEFGREARRELIYKAQRRQLDLAAPVWIISPGGLSVQAPHVRDYGARPVAAAWDNETVWFDKA